MHGQRLPKAARHHLICHAGIVDHASERATPLAGVAFVKGNATTSAGLVLAV